MIDDSGSGKVGDLTDRRHSLYRKIADWIHPQVPKEVFREIIKSNVCNLQWIAAAVSILEVFILVLYMIRHADRLADELDSMLSVLFCIVLSIIVAVHLSKVTRSEELLEQKLYRERGVLIAYYTVLMIWGMAASYRHYVAGEQMITFFIVEVVFASFVSLEPMISFILLLTGHTIFFYMIFMIDGACRLNILNYFALGVLLWLGMTLHYRILARQIAQRQVVEHLNRQLNELSLTDPLTGIGNRLALKSKLKSVPGCHVTVMMADIDHFKEVNDTFGHEVGDQILTRVSEYLRQSFPRDCCFRYGGDEFLVLMHDISEEEFNRRRSQWLSRISQIELPESSMTISCSSGYITGSPRTDIEVQELIRDADLALYCDKKNHHEMNNMQFSRGGDLSI
ncbi:MAG: GGDEF domain-containing protein [Oribacterium sp.]|nr:GGDEF domain-containing protein [Oribacterium sp.]